MIEIDSSDRPARQTGEERAEYVSLADEVRDRTARSRVPRVLEYCCTVALVGAALLTMGVLVALVRPGPTAETLMLCGASSIVFGMIAATVASVRSFGNDRASS